MVFCFANYPSIGSIKDGIQDMTGIPSFSQRLSFAGKLLCSEYSVSSYDIEDGCVIDLSLILAGGAFHMYVCYLFISKYYHNKSGFRTRI